MSFLRESIFFFYEFAYKYELELGKNNKIKTSNLGIERRTCRDAVARVHH
jgi:hypothetical protein